MARWRYFSNALWLAFPFIVVLLSMVSLFHEDVEAQNRVSYHPSEEHRFQMRHAVLEVQSGIWERATVVYGPAEIGVGSPPVRTTNPNWPTNLDGSAFFINPTNMQGGSLARPYFAYTNILYYQKKQISNLLYHGKWVATNLLGGETTILDDMNSFSAFTYGTNDLHLTEDQLWINVSKGPGGDEVDASFWTNHTHFALMSHLDAYRTVDDILYNMVWTYNQGYMDDDMEQIEDDAGLDTNQVGSLYLEDSANGCNFDTLCAAAVTDWDWLADHNIDLLTGFACFPPPNGSQYNYPHAYSSYNWDRYIMWYESRVDWEAGYGCYASCEDDVSNPLVTNYYLQCDLMDEDELVANPRLGGVLCIENHADCDAYPGTPHRHVGPQITILGIETNACNFAAKIAEWTALVPSWIYSNTCDNTDQSISWTLSRNSFPVRWDMVNSNDFDGEALEAMSWELYFGRDINICSDWNPPMRVDTNWSVEAGMGDLRNQEWANYTNGVMIQGLEYIYQDDWVTDSFPFDEDCGTPGNDNDEVAGWDIGNAILICDYCESTNGFIFCPETDVDPLPVPL